MTYGPDSGKLAIIVDILDHNRALIDGPLTGVARQVLSFKRLRLTKILVKLPRGAREKTVKKVWQAEQVSEKWSQTASAKKAARVQVRKNLNDFERFKVMALKQRRAICSQSPNNILMHIINYSNPSCFYLIPILQRAICTNRPTSNSVKDSKCPHWSVSSIDQLESTRHYDWTLDCNHSK